MKVKALRNFRDLKDDKRRKKGDTFIVSQERFEELNATKYGKLVDEVKEKPNKKAGD